MTSLRAIQKKGYSLAIVSGIRKDIITGLLSISRCPIRFDFIYGQDPFLTRDDNQTLLNALRKHGKINYVIGDKLEDLKPARKMGAKSIFLKGGHASRGEERFADYSIQSAKELLTIIQ